jgi:hypothetical protein
MATMPEADRPEGAARVWATYTNPARAERVARELADAGIDPARIGVSRDPGTSEGPLGREREHREGSRIVGRLALGGVVGASIGALIGLVLGLTADAGSTGIALFTLGGALFAGGVGAFVSGLSSLRSAAPDHRSAGNEAPGGTAVEVRGGGADPEVLEVLRRHHPTTLVMTDALGRPMRDADAR